MVLSRVGTGFTRDENTEAVINFCLGGSTALSISRTFPLGCSFLRMVVLTLQLHLNHLEALKQRAEPHRPPPPPPPTPSLWFSRSGERPGRICIFIRFPGDADAVGLGTTPKISAWAQFLRLGTLDILCQIILCCVGLLCAIVGSLASTH